MTRKSNGHFVFNKSEVFLRVPPKARNEHNNTRAAQLKLSIGVGIALCTQKVPTQDNSTDGMRQQP